MTIDLKWALPFVLPFVILLGFRLLCFLAGATWVPEIALVFSIMSGAFSGAAYIIYMLVEEIRWDIKIGGRND